MVKIRRKKESSSVLAKSDPQSKEDEVFLEGLANDDASKHPCLEMKIYHAGKIHEPQNPTDEVVYKYKSPGERDIITLDDKRINDLAISEDSVDEVCYEDQDKTVSVKKSLIDSYRLKSNYYGPLRIISEKIKVNDKGTVKEAIQAKLQHVEIQATDNDGKAVDDHELKILMSQTPGIIPACEPTAETDSGEYIILNLGNNEKYKVSKKALAAYQKLADVKPPFNTKIQKIFTNSEGVSKPVTVVILYPRVDKVVYKSVPEEERKQSIKEIITKKDKGKPKLVNYYRQNYINWAHRGNVWFSEIKKVGIDFLEEIIVENPIAEDSLKLLGCSPSTTAQDLEPVDPKERNFMELNMPFGSKEFVEDMWDYLTNIVRQDNFLIEFEFEMDEEKWLEIKRAFNMFQVNGEVIPDIVVKIVQKKCEDNYELIYYLRCIGRLVKSGPILSKSDISDLLKCLSKNKYICSGFSKENFLIQADQNEILRLHMKENSYLTMQPFESLHSKKCKAIVTDAETIENSKMERGSVVVYGPSVICQMCDNVKKKLKELVDPTLNIYAPQEICQRYIKQRYGPLHTINISENIKSLFTQTPTDFVSGVKRKISNSRIAEKEDSVIKQIKIVDENAEIFRSDRLPIRVTEEEFSKMITIRKYSKSSNALRKECEVCGYQAKSMVSLFIHMNDHLGPLIEQCPDCDMKLSSKEALVNHATHCLHSRKN